MILAEIFNEILGSKSSNLLHLHPLAYRRYFVGQACTFRSVVH